MRQRWRYRLLSIILLGMVVVITLSTTLVMYATPMAPRDITITFWQSLAYPYISSPINDIIEDFQKKHPHIHVNLVNTGGYDPTYIKLMNLDKIDEDKWPDVALIYDIGLGGMVMNRHIIPISRFMVVDKKQFIPSALSYYTLWDTIYGLPFNSSVPVLYVNNTLREKYQIKDIPTSLRDMTTLCNTQYDKRPALLTFPLHSWIIEQLVAVDGATLLNHRNGRTKPGTKLSDEAIIRLQEALQYIKSLKANGCLIMTSPKSWEEANQNFFDGKSIMLITSSSDKNYIFQQMKKRGYSVSVYPMIGINQRNNNPIIGGAALYVVKKNYTKEKKEAIKTFLAYLTSYEAQKYLSTHTGYLPINIKAWNEEYKEADKDTQTILQTFMKSGDTIASKGAVSPAMYKVRFVMENTLADIDHLSLSKAVDNLKHKTVYYIANTEALLYKPHIIIIGSLSLLLLLLAYTSYLILLKHYESMRNTMVWLSIPVILAVISTTYRNPLVYSIGMVTMSIIIGYGIFLLMHIYKKDRWLFIPLMTEVVFSSYYIHLALTFNGLYIPSRIYIYMFTLLTIPLILALAISMRSIPFALATLLMALLPASFYATYTTKLTFSYTIVSLSFLFVILGIILIERREREFTTIFRTTSLRIGIGTALLIVIIISVIPAFLYWKNIYDISSAIEDTTFNAVLRENSIDKQIGTLLTVALGGDTLQSIHFSPLDNNFTLIGKHSTATLPAQTLIPFLNTTLQFYEFSLYDIKGNLIIGKTPESCDTSIITRPLSSTRSNLHLISTIYDRKIASYITSNFTRVTIFGYYPFLLVFISILLIFYFSAKKINDMLWEEVEAKTSELMAMEDSIKEAYNDLQKEHELLMLLIRSIIGGHRYTSATDFLMEIGRKLQERSDEVRGFFIYTPDGTIVQSEVAVNIKNLLRKMENNSKSSIVETDEGSFILTRLSTGHTLGIALTKQTEYTNTIVDVMDAFVSLLSTFMNLEMLREKTEKMHTHILMALVGALDLKDPYTKGHSLHVAEASIHLGKQLGLTDEELSKLYMAAILHDIGKISIPDKILGKPGRLTDEEYEIIKSHPVMGYKLLESIEGMEEISKIILYHHERCDGKGYPEGLTCDQIPMLSKIIAIADAFDAMVNRRVYRKALSLQQATAEIQKNLGTQFDTYIGRKFLEIASEIYQIIKQDSEGEIFPFGN